MVNVFSLLKLKNGKNCVIVDTGIKTQTGIALQGELLARIQQQNDLTELAIQTKNNSYFEDLEKED